MLPVSVDEIRAACEVRIAPYLTPTPLRAYAELDAAVGHGIRVFVKHENFQPTGAFKVRNGLSLMTALPDAERQRGVVAATRGNHGLGVAFAAHAFGVRATICVPVGNNPEKNAAMCAIGARVVEEGRDYDDATAVADRIVRDEGATLAHSTNDRRVIAGAGTMLPADAGAGAGARRDGDRGRRRVAGGWSDGGGARPEARARGVRGAGGRGAGGARSWHAGRRLTTPSADTFADGLATRATYDLTFPALQESLADFVTVTDAEIAEAMRLVLRTTHSLVEGAGAAGLAGLRKLAPRLRGQCIGVVLSGANVDLETLRRVASGEL